MLYCAYYVPKKYKCIIELSSLNMTPDMFDSLSKKQRLPTDIIKQKVEWTQWKKCVIELSSLNTTPDMFDSLSKKQTLPTDIIKQKVEWTQWKKC